MTKADIILIGAGGHCRSVIDVIEATGKYTIKGIIDQAELVGKEILGYKITGTDNDLEALTGMYQNFHITVGHIRSNAARVRLFEFVRSKGGIFPSIIAPSAYVSKHAVIGAGSVIMHQAFVNAGAGIGNNCIINTGAVIEHDSVIEDHCHIATGAHINGGCTIHANSFIGSQATIVQGITVGNNTMIAAGSVLITNAEPNSMYAGNPATKKKAV